MTKPFTVNTLSKSYGFLTLISVLAVFAACKRNDGLTQEQQISFNSKIEGTLSTRATDLAWDQGDKIGVYMFKSGEALNAASIVGDVNNTAFTANGSVFQSASPVYLSASNVDFIAYYPYRQLSGFSYEVDLSDQQDQNALDLMYAANAKNIGAGTFSIPLTFSRQLSKLVVNLNITNTGALTAAGLTATLSGAATKASFDVTNGALTVNAGTEAAVEGKVIALDGGKGRIEFTLLPGENLSGKKIRFKATTGDSYTWVIPQFQSLVKGSRYLLDITINNGEPNGGPITTQPFPEIPKMGNLGSGLTFITKKMPDNAKRRNYSYLYDNNLRMAYWVAYPLHASYIGSSGRTDEWQYDPDISQAFQPQLFSGFSQSGFDRGHQIPSADRTSSRAANETTFYFSNMTAQNSRLNQGIWASLEGKIRVWTAQCDTMYVVTGAMPTTSENNTVTYTPDNGNKSIAVPKYYFKALAMRKGNDYYTIAYKMDNAVPATNSYTAYQLPVADLEKATGFTFFPDLSESQKSVIDATIWK